MLKALASRWLTVAFFISTGLFAFLAKETVLLPTVAMALPLSLLVLNLAASVLTHPRFRGDFPLLVFHLALLALVVLFTVGRLTYLYGSISVTRGMPFDGVIDKLDKGPFHPLEFNKLSFEHAGLSEEFQDDVGHFLQLITKVRWLTEEGWKEADLGFGYPIVLNGYRIYPSARRGYTPMFHWKGKDGREELGAVQLFGPAESVMENTNDWIMPDGTAAWLQLDKEDKSLPVRGTKRINMDTEGVKHKLILRVGDVRHELVLGGSVVLPNGTLTYVNLESWGGYSLIYDPTESWLIATILVAIGSLAVFYYRRFQRRPTDLMAP